MKYGIFQMQTKSPLYWNGARKFSTVNPGNWTPFQTSDARQAYVILGKWAPLDYRVMAFNQ